MARWIMMAGMCVLAAACQAGDTSTDRSQTPEWQFFQVHMKKLCGQTVTGRMVSDDPVDAKWRDKTLTLGPISCETFRRTGQLNVMTMPLAVGEDESRTWRLIPRKNGLLLNHTHLLADGSPDPVSGYGGVATAPGTNYRKDFPVDDYSIALFKEHGLEASITNVWSLEINPNDTLAYELNRENRNFRVEFNLSTAVEE